MKNKYKTAFVLFICLSILMIVIIMATTLVEYQNYLEHTEYSTPFSVNLMFNSVTSGIAIIVGLVFSFIFKKKVLTTK